RPRAGTRATAGRDGVPLLGGEWGRADADRQDVFRRRCRLLGRRSSQRGCPAGRRDVRRERRSGRGPVRRLRGSRPLERSRMSPAAPTRPDATINATDEATAPPLDDALAARGEAPGTPRNTRTRRHAGRSAEIAAAFDELAPVYDRLTTILSLGLDRRWRSAVVAETRLTPGASAIEGAAVPWRSAGGRRGIRRSRSPRPGAGWRPSWPIGSDRSGGSWRSTSRRRW